MIQDLSDAGRVIDYAHKRIFEEEVLPAREKILSLSDGSVCLSEIHFTLVCQTILKKFVIHPDHLI